MFKTHFIANTQNCKNSLEGTDTIFSNVMLKYWLKRI